ncbi:ferritin-like domain-containing protein [Kitasatospora sp. NBC_01250]|uniref:ferritin-like domain-containing protein n=1 Tax=Kitasatospora sp. NBC_01250 TaxID=2903571 RepID=UPI002E3045FA|nr:ferritin-like domain-containing protein [Kitasatospora sp. NBC_01250]
MQSPSRRTFLASGALAVAGLLTACTSSGGRSDGSGGPGRGSAKPDPDLALRTKAVAATDALLAQYASVTGAGGGSGSPVAQLRTEVAAQRSALAAGLPAGAASPSGSAAAAPPGSSAPGAGASAGGASGGPGTPTGQAALAAAEWSTAQARLTDLAAASPELARLLASVSAAGALHAVELGNQAPFAASAPPSASPADPPSAGGSPGTAGGVPSGTASPGVAASDKASAGAATPGAGSAALPAGAVTALQAALAGEHSAVYAFGVIAARIAPGAKRDDARSCYAAHQARRDAWQRLLTGAGANPTAAAPGYQLPFAVTDAGSAARLAAEIETRLTAVYADLVAAGSGALRLDAATALRACTLQANHWGATPGALPGLPAPASGAASGPPPSR